MIHQIAELKVLIHGLSSGKGKSLNEGASWSEGSPSHLAFVIELKIEHSDTV
jgi:hypothetical protein